jgi:hypothetical protein
MSAPVLLGFVADPALTFVPDGLAIVASGGCGAVVSDILTPADLPAISKRLLMIQRESAVVPLRPGPVPTDLPERMAQLAPRLSANFARLGRAVEFVVQIAVSQLPPELGQVAPKDYLRSELERKRVWERLLDQRLFELGQAIAPLQSGAIETRDGKLILKEMASIHYLMPVELSSEVVSGWQHNCAPSGAGKAVLAGPWAPYSFVDLGI